VPARRIAPITGVGGQDGDYLAEYLLRKCRIVHDMKRRAFLMQPGRIDHCHLDR